MGSNNGRRDVRGRTQPMLSRISRVSRPRFRSAFELLECRTLLSSGSGTLAETMFQTSYAALSLRPALDSSAKSTSPQRATAPTTTVATAEPMVAQETPTTFLDALNVDVDPDGTAGAYVRFQSDGAGPFTATARWDGGTPEATPIDQPGAGANDPNVGAVYAIREALPAGQHTLELTITDAATGTSASESASFTVGGDAQSPLFSDGSPGGIDSAGATDGAMTDTPTSSGPTVQGVFADSTQWSAAFHDYLTNNILGDRGFRVSDGADQLKDLPWVNLDRVSIRFNEDVTVTQGDLLVSGAFVTTYGYAASGFSYDPSSFTATWTLDRSLPAEKVRLQLRDTVHDSSGAALDGEWSDGADTYGSGDGTAGGNFNFRFNVVPGDVTRDGRVNAIDIAHVRTRVGRSTTNPGAPGTATYTAFDDLDGSGDITGDTNGSAPGDLGYAKGNQNGTLPAADPLPLPDPTVSIADAPRTWSYYLDDAWGNTVKTRFDSRTYLNMSPSADRTYDPVPGPGDLTYTLLSNASNGGLEFAADGNWTYTPQFDKQGPDHFRYNVTDTANVSRPADVFIETTREPVYANDDWFGVGDGTDVVDSASSVLDNDLGSPVKSMPSLTASGGGGTARGGSVTVDPDGKFHYTPPSGGLIGRDSFTYTMQETRTGKSANATVVLDGGANFGDPLPAPVPYNRNTTSYGTAGAANTFQTIHDRTLTGGSLASMFQLYGYDPEYGAAAVTDQGGSVTVTDPETGAFTYTPKPGFTGWDSFNASLTTDAGSSSKPQKVFVLVTDSVPRAVDQEYPTEQDTPVEGQLIAIDNDDDPVKFRTAIMPAHGQIDVADDGSFTYVPDAGFVGTDAYTYFANDSVFDGGLATVYFNVLTGTGTPYIDLDAMTVTHNVGTGYLPDSQEETTGAFVPINNDDDDYDLGHSLDQAEDGPIAGENDLLPIYLHRVMTDGDEGIYQLDIPGNVKVWWYPDKGTDDFDRHEVTSATTISAGENTTLYVEGITPGTGTIRVNWSSEDKAPIPDADRVKVTVFNWSGPLNVPGYSIHHYVADAEPNSEWLSGDGTIVGGETPSDVYYRSGRGGTIEHRGFKVNQNYLWDLDVNVVAVTVRIPTTAGVSSFATGTAVDAGQFTDSNNIYRKLVSGSGPALAWAANLTLDGPAGRGVDMMVVGFVQNLTHFQHRGIYQSGFARISNMDGMATPVLDRYTGFSEPWYVQPVGGENHHLPQFAENLHPASGQSAVSVDIGATDSPADGPPMTFAQHATVQAGDDQLTKVVLQYDFQLDICVKTKDTREGANKVFTRRATVPWTFDGQGTVAIGAPYKWTSTAPGFPITVPPGWFVVQDGSQPKELDGDTGNELLSLEVFFGQ